MREREKCEIDGEEENERMRKRVREREISRPWKTERAKGDRKIRGKERGDDEGEMERERRGGGGETCR
eukprot:1386377-Amorphochlora_amoeboformis.AAC.1